MDMENSFPALSVRAVIFDLDGVILDSMGAHVASWGRAFAEQGLHVEPAFFYEHEGALDFDLLKNSLAERGNGLTPGMLDHLLSRQREIYLADHLARIAPYPEAVRLVERLSDRNLLLGLATSSNRQVLSPELLAWLDRRFQAVVTGDMVARRKPHPDPYLKTLDLLKLAPEQALVVENAPAGIRAARSAGLACLALCTTLPPDRLAEADRVFPDHDALHRFLNPESALLG